jgi:error-prone DNA polymerase
MDYAELHCRTNFSFLSGASNPAEIVARAGELGLTGLAITDQNGLYGVVRAHEARAEFSPSLKLISGSELDLTPMEERQGVGSEEHRDGLVLLARTREGYANLSRLITQGHLRCEKGEFSSSRAEVLERAKGLIALAGGPRSRALRLMREERLEEASRDLSELKEAFGDALYVELTEQLRPGDHERTAAMVGLANALGIPSVATNDVHFHDLHRKPLHDIVTCIREKTTLERAGRLLLPNAERRLKSPNEMSALFREYPDTVARTVEIAGCCTFSLDDLRYQYPEEAVPPGESPEDFLARLAFEGARRRLGEATAERERPRLEKELAIIRTLRYAGYFLTMWDVVNFCRSKGILCQGRGSAANSVVCYALGITSVSPDDIDMLFERFLSVERNSPPDIDLDIEHERREEVIQYVYEKYGRERAAMVAEVICYRSRMAVREVGKAMGLTDEHVLRLTRFLSHSYHDLDEKAATAAGFDPKSPILPKLLTFARELEGFPRHLSIHVGGFMLAKEPVPEVVPIENARMEGRTVIQWDKDDVDTMRVFKVDLLGLGMLTMISKCFALIEKHRGIAFDLGSVPRDDEPTYEMIRRADTVGVFQIESRAQMSMLPRLLPREFYDLVIEVAIVRPGPIQGGMVHPFLRRRRGEEEVKYPHPKLEQILKRTLGVPLFQEQVMRLAEEVGGYSPGEADQLRRDMAAWRRSGHMDRHRERLIRGMLSNGLSQEFAEQVFRQIQGFGEYGFPESHAAAFAHLAYVSAYLKCHFPAEFACALLNSQPMGFYQIATILNDAKRHGVTVLPVDVQHSSWDATIETLSSWERVARPASRVRDSQKPSSVPHPVPLPEGEGGAVRVGVRFVHSMGDTAKEPFLRARETGPFVSVADFARRTGISRTTLSSLAAAGAFRSLEPERRTAIWQAAALGDRDLVGRADSSETRVSFAPLTEAREVAMDYAYSGTYPGRHPMELIRLELAGRGVLRALDIWSTPPQRNVDVAGLVIVRQRPGGKNGVVFMSLEDETGQIDVVILPKVFLRYQALIRFSDVLMVHGRLEADGGARSVRALRFVSLDGRGVSGVRSRDFH